MRTPLREQLLVRAVVATEPRSVLVAPGQALTRRDELRLADLAGEVVLESPDGLLGVGRPVGVEELLARVAAGDAVVVPEAMVREHGAGLADVALADAPPSRIVVVGGEPLVVAVVYVGAVWGARLRLVA